MKLRVPTRAPVTRTAIMNRLPEMLAALLTAGALCALAPAPAWAQDEEPGAEEPQKEDATRRVRLLLSAHHELPPRALFVKATPRARDVLLEIARDDQIFRLHRYRALEALGSYWADDEVLDLYARLLRGSETELLEHRVMMFAASSFGRHSVPLLVPYLSSPQMQLRLTAVEALALVDEEPSRDALRARLEAEPSELVRERIEHALLEIR